MMQCDPDDRAFIIFASRAGVHLKESDYSHFEGPYRSIAAMAELIRKPRSHMAQPALVFYPCEKMT
ncbi:hypothetical protein NKH80_29855 [Mesorhizobium sp. M0904]|uniref:hypothetical protein n=1 Tax=Mesorhizobium sp. M0904 TaxID=2957022 RepID=UPI00333C364D